ncbi:rod shape-determining protein MreD [uncultured Muribaculum sp.]|uniref:rod shape-determining protein MreD n=1 Tax=uncultured Muribaculum sp. TaxID=1918613 RepID=UPI00259A3183|nr:rod shape-determining protein MreD [uncultured Muribaculum sp.]
MTKTIFQFLLLFIILILLQAIVFNNICLFGVAVPFVFIYFIVHLPVTISSNWLLTLSFLTGLTIDIFANTQGMNSLACTIVAMCRHNILHWYFPREDELTIPEPSIRSLGIEVFSKYLFTFVLFYCTIIFLIESFSFFNIFRLLLRILCSTLLTFLLLLGVDSMLSQRR